MDEKTTQIIDKLDRHNATSSWSGYAYQGKVAIYTALALINEMKIYKQEKNIDLFKLEIESLEDFSILNGDKYQSIHQVKSYKDNKYIKKYKSAILDLLGKTSKYEISNSYLHTVCKIESTTKQDLKKILEEYSPESKKDAQDSYKGYLFEKDFYDKAYEGFIYNVSEGESFNTVIDLEDTEKEIKNQIRIFFENSNSEMENNPAFYIENVHYIYLNFISEINNIIAHHHKCKSSEEPPIISFSRLFEILTKKNIFELTPDTLAHMLKDQLYKHFLDFLDEVEGEFTEEQVEVWNKSWEFIDELDNNQVLTLFKKISPSKAISNDTHLNIEDYVTLINEGGLKYNLFWLVLCLSYSPETYEKLFILNKESYNYLITTIDNRKTKNIIDKLGRKISENIKMHNELLPLLYDVNNLVNTHISGVYNGNILDLASAYKSEYPELYDEQGKNITEPKKIEFVKIDEIVEEFE
ncbi:ABC-three component system protein [Pseudalkalibacillus hwajinpoensis]|uniref:ABC-three component system protein n=1 Tax=Guptibacillus hwajinpoensis TaxID=208199 RepID=UPI00325B3EC8